LGSHLEVTVLGELHEKSLDELLLGQISEVGLLGEGLAHGLGLLHDYLGHVGLRSHHLGDGQRGLNLEVLGVVVLHGLLGGNGLDELVVGGDLSDGGRSHLGGLVRVAEEVLTVGSLENLLRLGSENESGDLVGDGSSLDICDSLFVHKHAGDLLALLAGGNSGVRVVQKSNERVLLLKVGVVGLDGHKRGHAEGEGGEESNEFA
jgi:hypothetical protein